MKNLLLLFFLFLLVLPASAQTHRRGHGAANVQELGQSVFNALKDNQFSTLSNYLPDEVELRILRRRSSADMRAVLDQTSPDSVKQIFQRNFNQIAQQTTGNAFNWQNWELSDTKASQIDKKNPLLYRVTLTMANPAGAQQTLLFEALQIRRRFYLFNKIAMQPTTALK